MRPARVLLSAIVILISCSSVHASAGEPGDIAVPSMNTPNMDMPKPLVSRPNMDIPEPQPKPLEKPDNNINQALSQIDNVSSNQTQAAQIQTQQSARPMDVSGKWSIKFDDGTDRHLDLTLWSSTEITRIMGFGTLTEEGIKNSVTASGSVTAQELSLAAKLATPENANLKYDECDLELFTANDTLSGSYVLRSAGNFLVKGNATAVKQ